MGIRFSHLHVTRQVEEMEYFLWVLMGRDVKRITVYELNITNGNTDHNELSRIFRNMLLF